MHLLECRDDIRRLQHIEISSKVRSALNHKDNIVYIVGRAFSRCTCIHFEKLFCVDWQKKCLSASINLLFVYPTIFNMYPTWIFHFNTTHKKSSAAQCTGNYEYMPLLSSEIQPGTTGSKITATNLQNK